MILKHLRFMSGFTLTTSLRIRTWWPNRDLSIYVCSFGGKVFRSNACAIGRTVLIAALFFRSNFENTVKSLALRNSKTLITMILISSAEAAPSLYSKTSSHTYYKSRSFSKCAIFLG